MTTINLKRSAVANKVPTTADIALGEIAINTHDGRIFIKKDNGTESVLSFLDKTSNDGLYAPVSHSHAFSTLTSIPTTIAGYGITDAYTVTNIDALLSDKSSVGHTHTFADIASKPTTLSGFGITNAYTKGEVDSAIALVIPTQTGNSGKYLTTNGTSTSWATVSGGGGADTRIASFPVTPTAAPTCAGTSATNQLAIGDGAVVAGNNNNSIAIGLSRATGLNTIAIGIGDNTTSYGARTDYSVAIGKYASTWLGGAVAIGFNTYAKGVSIGPNTTSEGQYDIAIGEGSKTKSSFISQIAIGYSAGSCGEKAIAIGQQAGQVYTSGLPMNGSISLGYQSKPEFHGDVTYSTGYSTSAGDVKISNFPMWCQTSNANPIELKTGTGANAATPTGVIILSNNSTYIFDCDIVGRYSGADTSELGHCAFNLKFVVNRRSNAATTVISSQTLTVLYRSSADMSVTVEADTTNGRPAIKAIGTTSGPMKWVANVRLTKVLYN